jgi:hypothetical protein
MSNRVLTSAGAALSLAALILSAPVQAVGFGDMMNPGKWFGGNKNDDYYDGPYGYPGYGYPGGYGYGYPGGYGGYPGYGYGGYPGYGYGGYPGYGPQGYAPQGYGGQGSSAPAPAPAPQ